MRWLRFPSVSGARLKGILNAIWTRVFRRSSIRDVPDEARRFYERLERELANAHEDVVIVGPTREGFGAVLRVERQEIAVPLGEVFLREKAFPDSFAATVDRLVGEIREHLASTSDLLFDEAIDILLPQIRSEDWIRGNSPAFGPGSLVREELLEGLCLCFVLDEGDSMVFLTEGHLRAWGIDTAAVKNLAMTNLRRLASSSSELGLESGAAATQIVSQGDGYDAARMLLALERDVDDVGGLVFAVPDRDTLVVGRKDTGLAQLMSAVDDEFERSEHPISPDLYEIRDRRLARLPAAESTSG